MSTSLLPAEADLESLCALLDGELGVQATQTLVTRLCREAALASAWLQLAQTHSAMQALHGTPHASTLDAGAMPTAPHTTQAQAQDDAFMARFTERLRQEPVVFAPSVAAMLAPQLLPAHVPAESNNKSGEPKSNDAVQALAANDASEPRKAEAQSNTMRSLAEPPAKAVAELGKVVQSKATATRANTGTSHHQSTHLLWRLAAAVAGVALVGALVWRQYGVESDSDTAASLARNDSDVVSNATDAALSEDDLNEYLDAHQAATPGTLGLVRQAHYAVPAARRK